MTLTDRFAALDEHTQAQLVHLVDVLDAMDPAEYQRIDLAIKAIAATPYFTEWPATKKYIRAAGTLAWLHHQIREAAAADAAREQDPTT